MTAGRKGEARGWGVALGGVAVAGAALFLARTAPLPERGTGRAGPAVRWGGAGAGDTADWASRLVAEPTLFALGSPVGFTHAWNAEKPSAEAPAGRPEGGEIPAARGGAKDGAEGGAGWTPGWAKAAEEGKSAIPPGGAAGGGKRAESVAVAAEGAAMSFSEGWSARMFEGVDLGYGSWGKGEGWTAAAEVAFDATGVPVRVLVTERSGVAAVDKRLAREVWKWRLRDAEAAREGRVRWRVPPKAAVAAPAKGAEEPAGAGEKEEEDG